MARNWKSFFGIGKPDPDPSVVAMLEKSEQQLAEAQKRSSDVNSVSGYLATRPERNHFGDALTISFTPRSRHV